MFIRLLISILNESNHTKCILLRNQKCIIQLTLINLHPNKYSQEFHYYPFAVKLDVLEVAILLMTYLINYEIQNRRFKSKHVQHDYKNKCNKIIDKAYIMWM